MQFRVLLHLCLLLAFAGQAVAETATKGKPSPVDGVPVAVAEQDAAVPAVAQPKAANRGKQAVRDGKTSLEELQRRPVDIAADRLEQDEQAGWYRAEGNVRVTSGPVSLLSDRVRVNPETEDVLAEGHVVLEGPEGILRGDRLAMNLGTGLGRLDGGSVFLRENNFHIAGDLIEKIGEKTYTVRRGTFTSCDGIDPDWHFSARDLKVTVDGYARGRHAFFYLGGLPVLYTPYILFPVKRERETGLLMSSFGYSQRRGTQISVPFYWAIARNQDATFYLDWLSELGLGKGIEYRYIFGQENAGEARYYHVSGTGGAGDRYAVEWDHVGPLPGGWIFTSDSEYVSSRDYWQDFGEVAGEYNKDKVDSTLTLGKGWRRINLTGQLRYSKDLQGDNDQTLQRLPEVRLDVLRQRIGQTAYSWELESSATYFWRREGIKGERLLLRPALSADWSLWDVFEIQPTIGYTERLYWTSNDGPGYEEKGLFDFSTRVSTRISRVYQPVDMRVERLRHSIEPDIRYEFVPNRDQSQLPEFDVRDRIDARNRISYGLVNRFVGRWSGEDGSPVYHEFLYLRLSQEYDIRESRRSLLDPTDEKRPFSSLRTEMILRPNAGTLLDLDFRYDPDAGRQRFSTFNLLGRYRDGRGNGIKAEYRYARNQVEYVDATLEFDLFRPVYLDYRHRYDLRDDEELEKALDLEYRSQCWSLFLTLRDREGDRSFMVTFELAGLGRVGSIGGSLGGGN
ncbi:LPS-assembly protein [Geothermobacter ehrlichii]|uniref:LPS-assembly protein n=1 Tax=Geothermobacter ehrlichii TaxID=213224 RepID=A0A5D3WFF3_9BACT|nr:LPS assembly protein LptD [Geothermobacter ehrlichii]TYO95690.1 LPS-assembly protein [Geothermobacter ehrlichii]